MHILRRRDWEIVERQVTRENAVLNRRSVLAGGTAIIALPDRAAGDVTANPAFKPDRAVTHEKYATVYKTTMSSARARPSGEGRRRSGSGPGLSSWTG